MVKSVEQYKLETEQFIEKAKVALSKLFAKACLTDELHFVLSLNPELRGAQDPGWCTAQEAYNSFEQYMQFLKQYESSPIKTRIALSFYCHLAEAAGFYEVLKNLLSLIGGYQYSLWPFQDIVKTVKKGGQCKSIPPNVSKVFKKLTTCANAFGHEDLGVIFQEAFDGEIRHAYAHADYILWIDGIRLRKRNGGQPRIVSYEEFAAHLNRAINFFCIICNLIEEHKLTYKDGKRIKGKLSENDPQEWWIIHYDKETGAFSIKGDGFVLGK